MEESYTLTVIEDTAVPLAAVPGGGLALSQTLFIILVLSVMAACAVIYMYRYLERCRKARLRLEQLQADVSDHRYDLRFLEGEILRLEAERADRIVLRMRD